MIKVRVLTVNHTKEKWLEDALEEYFKRLTSKAAIDFCLYKGNKELLSAIEKEKSLILLDPSAKQLTSEEFADYFFSAIEKGGSRLSFAIGGPDGFPKSLSKNMPSLSLSKLTLTHQMVRLLLVEQIYRAFEIRKGSHYHK